MNIPISENLAEFYGALMGDGFIGCYGVRGQNKTIQFSGHPIDDKKYYETKIIPLFKQLFNKTPRVYLHQRALRANIYSKEVYAYLVSLGFPSGKKGPKLKIPTIFMKDIRITKAVVRGFFDTDGFIYWDFRKVYIKPYPRIGITTISFPLLVQLIDIFKELNFPYYVRSEKRSRAHHIEIYGKKQVDRWFKEFKPSNFKHLKKYELKTNLPL